MHLIVSQYMIATLDRSEDCLVKKHPLYLIKVEQQIEKRRESLLRLGNTLAAYLEWIFSGKPHREIF